MGIATSPAQWQGLRDLGYVTAELQASALVRRVDNEEGAFVVNRRMREGVSYAGLVFPYYWPGVAEVKLERLRLDRPLNGRTRYLSPGQGWGRSRFYIHRMTPVRWLSNAEVPAVFCEGEKKALALYRYFGEIKQDRLVVGLSGVWNWLYQGWRSEQGDIIGEDGFRASEPLPDFDDILWRGRQVAIFFDANVHTNRDVRAARKRLGRELQKRGAVVAYWNLPANLPSTINGVDDYLTEFGADALTELLATAGDASEDKTELELTDFGLVNKLYEIYPGDFGYTDELGGWAGWTGTHWDFHEGAALLQTATVETSYAAALEHVNQAPHSLDGGEKLRKWAAGYRSSRGISSARNVAMLDSRFRRGSEVYDKNPWLLNVANGTLDLRTGELHEFDRNDFLTRRLEVAWDAEATCPTWEKFMLQIMGGDRQMVEYLGESLGYCLSGDTSEQCFYIWQGSGANGKGALIRVLQKLMGTFLKNAAASSFEANSGRSAAHADDLAGLRAGHLVVASETNRQVRLDEALIKRVSGQDSIRVSFKGKSFFEYAPKFKVIFLVNDKPYIGGLDEGIWRRVHLVVFPVRFVAPGTPGIDNKTVFERDDTLEERLFAELPGILAWLVRLLHQKLERGYTVPDKVRAAVKSYRADMDSLSDWLNGCCIFDESFYEGVGELYRSYKSYCEGDEEKPMSQRAFGIKLEAKGYTLTRTGAKRYRTGLQLKVGA